MTTPRCNRIIAWCSLTQFAQSLGACTTTHPAVTGVGTCTAAGARHRSAAGPDEDDGILTAEEIATIDRSNAK